ncbi:MAG: hypothetical protein DCC65_12915 [Planctomycetota bacterium]|nr:MAG: hypothetical protein DCC65_12915 [Planctomycetota bacterium]
MSTHLPTPIPLGPAHLTTPPLFEESVPRTSGTRRFNRLDNRDYSRRPLAVDVWLVDPHTQTILRCKTDDISDAGLHAHAPIGFGLAIGQRYEARIVNSPPGMRLNPEHLTKSLGYGTVIRTEMRIEGTRDDRIGFALRFDVPQLLPI